MITQAKNPLPFQFVTRKQAAAALCCSEQQISILIKARRLRALHLGRSVRVDATSLTELAQQDFVATPKREKKGGKK